MSVDLLQTFRSDIGAAYAQLALNAQTGALNPVHFDLERVLSHISSWTQMRADPLQGRPSRIQPVRVNLMVGISLMLRVNHTRTNFRHRSFRRLE